MYSRVGLATLPPCHAAAVAQIFTGLLEPEFIPYNNMLELTLSNQGQIIHPGIMYGAFADKLDESYREDEIPLFYRSVEGKTADLLEAMSREILKIKEIIETNFNIELRGVQPIARWLLESYGEEIEDRTSLAGMFQTNRSYQGLKVPVRPINGERYRIDVRSRYLMEDIPYGLLVSRAIAELAGVSTPRIDEVIEETSGWMGVQYLMDGRLEGRDLAKTRIPQNYGVKSLEALIEMTVGSDEKERRR
ncbi:TPA: hypothetical protein EYP12_01260 [Candidatus Bipolaricaulota bacterium]|nr:hypothetical protein [Candidatus Bipolaricaulota bacterium]